MLRVMFAIAICFLSALPAHADRASALKAVMADGPTVKDARWMESGWLYVGVLNNGTRRDGFAEYICSVLADNAVRGVFVKIVDIGAVVRNEKFEELGRARCR